MWESVVKQTALEATHLGSSLFLLSEIQRQCRDVKPDCEPQHTVMLEQNGRRNLELHTPNAFSQDLRYPNHTLSTLDGFSILGN